MFYCLLEDPENPSSEIKIVNFPGESILPIGSRVTILCSSNYSKKAVFDDQKNSQPYMIELSHNRRYLDDCGGDNTKDNEDIKTCFFVIQNATNKHSGIYSCAAHNVQQSCTTAEIKLEFESKLNLAALYQLLYPFSYKVTDMHNWHKRSVNAILSGLPLCKKLWYFSFV